MTSHGDKIRGTANEAVGKIKQGVGEATDNPRLKGEGQAQEVKGEAQQLKGEAKDAVKRATDRL